MGINEETGQEEKETTAQQSQGEAEKRPEDAVRTEGTTEKTSGEDTGKKGTQPEETKKPEEKAQEKTVQEAGGPEKDEEKKPEKGSEEAAGSEKDEEKKPEKGSEEAAGSEKDEEKKPEKGSEEADGPEKDEEKKSEKGSEEAAESEKDEEKKQEKGPAEAAGQENVQEEDQELAAEAEDELDEEPSFLVTESEKLNKKALRRAIKKDQTTSMLVKLETDGQINKAMRTIDKGFDHRLIAVINKWSTSEHPEREMDMIRVEGKKASEYMKENGYTFMDCVMFAQSAIEKNKPRVEIDVELSDEKGRFDRKMNLSDPGFKNIPPSHMPKLLNSFLQIVTLGFFQNRQDRMNHKKELEMIRFAAIEKEKMSRLEKSEKKAAAIEAQRKRAQNKEIATKALERQAEEKQYQYDKKHSQEKLKEMDAYRKEAADKMDRLAKKKAELTEKAMDCQARMKELSGAKEEVKEWLDKNKGTGWEKDPDKKKALSEMMEKVNAYNSAREEYGRVGKDMARVQRTADKLMIAVGVREGKCPRLTELYRKQGEHSLTEEERKELEELEKPGVIKGIDSESVKKAEESEKSLSEPEKSVESEKDAAEKEAEKEGDVKKEAEAEKEETAEAKKEAEAEKKETAEAGAKKEAEAEKKAETPAAEAKKESKEAEKKAETPAAEAKKESKEAEKKAETPAAEAKKESKEAEKKAETPAAGTKKDPVAAGKKDSPASKEAEKKEAEKKEAEKKAAEKKAEKSRQPDKKSGKKGPSRRR
ncbi:MAG: hypothetical protein OSJ69_12450 [Acetatifactor sp.]|nr:hypothetical protein [Acetatifactor sp.]